MKTDFLLKPIGLVKRTDEGIHIHIDPPYRSALEELEHFSHIMIFGWIATGPFPEYRQVFQTNPPYAEGHTTGVFATRSPFRPNPILMTTCKLLRVDCVSGLLVVSDLDMFDNTPIIDIKAYFPVCDRVENSHIPTWLEGWPEWMPEEGIGLMPHELAS